MVRHAEVNNEIRKLLVFVHFSLSLGNCCYHAFDTMDHVKKDYGMNARTEVKKIA